jgi:hypothetical protein
MTYHRSRYFSSLLTTHYLSASEMVTKQKIAVSQETAILKFYTNIKFS